MESRSAYRVQLTELVERTEEMCALAASAMEQATQALLRADLSLAEQVITDSDRITVLSSHAQENAYAVLALQAPVAGDLRAVVSSMQTATDINRMGKLARQVATVVRQRHPRHALPDDVRGYFTEIGRIAIDLGQDTTEILLSRDPQRVADIRDEDEAVDDLLRHLFAAVMDRDWKHGVAAAVDVTSLGRYYRRFADHAVDVARSVVFQAAGGERYCPAIESVRYNVPGRHGRTLNQA